MVYPLKLVQLHFCLPDNDADPSMEAVAAAPAAATAAAATAAAAAATASSRQNYASQSSVRRQGVY